VFDASRKRISDTFSTTLYANNAIQFLSSTTAKEKPFFCYVAFTSPHDPRTPPAAFEKIYDPATIPLPPNFLSKHPFDNGDMLVRDEHTAAHTPRHCGHKKRHRPLLRHGE